MLAQSDNSLKAYLTSIKGSTATMAGYNVSLQGSIAGFSKVSSAIKQYNALGTVSLKEQQAFATAVGATNSKLGAYLIGLNGSTAGLRGYGVSIVTSTAKTIGLTVATTALNAAMTMGISVIVTGLISAFTAWINKSEEITEKAQDAADKINSISESLKTNTETVENAKRRYAELAQEVENLGKKTQSQGTLSNEEYEEFLDLSNQLAGIFPSLSKNYDENGNAILDLSGDVNTIVGSLDDLIQKEKELVNQKIMEEFPAVFEGYAQDVSDAEAKVKSAQTEFDKINQAYNALGKGQSVQMGFNVNGYNEDTNTHMGTYKSWLEDLGLTYDEMAVKGGYVVTAIGDIDVAFTSKLEEARENLQYAQQQLEGEKSSIDSYLNTWLQSEFSYVQIEDSGLQTAIQDMLFNFDFSNIPENKRGDWNYVSEYLRRNTLFEINKVQDDPVISKAISEVFSNTELTPDEKANYLQQIQKYFGEDSSIVISLKPQIDEAETLQKQYDKAIEDTKAKFDSYNPTAFFQENSINTQEEIEKWLEIAQAANNAADAEERYVQSSTLDNKTPVLNTTKFLSELETLSKGLDQIAEIYADVYDKEGFDWSSILNNENFLEEFGNMTNVTDAYKDAYENFIKTVSNSPDDLDACQASFDDLATAYIYNSGILDNLTDETKNATIAFLEQKGVVNAEEVVVAKLTAKKEALALEERALSITKNGVTESTKDEISALLDAANASETTRSYLFKLIAEEQVFNSQTLTVSGKIKALENLAKAYGSVASSAAMSARLSYMKEQAEKSHITFNPTQADLLDLKKEIDDTIAAPVEIDYGGGSTTKSAKDKSSSDNNKPTEVTQEFNWIEKYLNAFARKTEKIMNKVSDYLSFKKNISTIKSAVKAIQKELSANEQALAEYEKQMAAIGLDPKYIEKIKNGAVEIEEIIGYETDGNKDANAQLIEKIQKYQALYDTYTSLEDTIEDLRNKEKDWLVKNLEYVNEYYQSLADIKNLSIDKKQDKIDLKEAQGKKVTASDYNGLLSSNQSYIKSLQTTYKKTSNQFNELVKNGTIEKDSKEWFTWTENLAGISSAIVQAKIDTEEWKDEIENLKLQKYTDAVDALKVKNEELNDVISQREAMGLAVREKDYSALAKNNNKQIQQLEQQNQLLQEYQSHTQKGSDRWKEFQEQIDSNNTSIRQLNQSTIELINNIANIPLEERDEALEKSSNNLNLLQKKYNNATSAQERKEILKLMEEEQKKQKELNEQAKTTAKNNLSESTNNLLNYRENQQSKVTKTSADIKTKEKNVASIQKDYDSLAKQETSLNANLSSINKMIKNTKNKTLLEGLNNQKEFYQSQLNDVQLSKEKLASQLTTAKKDLENSKAELENAKKNVSALAGFKDGEKFDTDGITDKETLKWIAEYNAALDTYEQAELDAALSDEEFTSQMRENAQSRLDAIKEEYESLMDLNDSYSDSINSLIDMQKVQGNPIEDSLYKDLINTFQKNADLAYEEWLKHSKQMAENDYSNDPEGYQAALAENNRLKSSWYESVKTAEEYLDSFMDTRIEALEEEKEKLSELHNLQERRYKLEEARYNLEKAKQKTNLVYNGEEFVYQSDMNSLKEAEKALEDAEYDELINTIEDLITTLEDAKEDINLYDANGNLLGNVDEIIQAAEDLGNDTLDGLYKLLKLNGYDYSGKKVQDIQTVSQTSTTDSAAFTAIQNDQMYQRLLENTAQTANILKEMVAQETERNKLLTLERTSNSSSIEITMGDMHFNEVENVSDLSKAIINGEFRSAIKNQLGQLKM